MQENILEFDNLQIEKYRPTMTKPFLLEMEPTTLMRRIRFIIDLIYGYSVYYIKKDGVYLGYCTITSGKNPRFWFANKSDIIIGPYFIMSQYRGNGYSTKLVQAVINCCEMNWRKAYLYILNTNAPSIRVAEKIGGRFLFHVHNTFFRRLKKRDDGEYGVYEVSR